MGKMLLLELRRAWATSVGLLCAGLAGSVAISNERGVFVPIHSVEEAIAAAASAFAAIAPPLGQVQLFPYSFLTGRIGPSGRGFAFYPGFPAAPNAPTGFAFPFARPLGLVNPAPVGGVFNGLNLLPNIPSQLPTTSRNNGLNPLTNTPSGPLLFRNAIPEPASWALMIVGFGTVGLAQRVMRRRRVAKRTVA